MADLRLFSTQTFKVGIRLSISILFDLERSGM